MKTRPITAMALGLATALSAPLCYGQSNSSEHEQKNSAKSEQLEHSEHLRSDKSSSAQDTDLAKEIRASKLIGSNVTTKDGENLGQVQDIVFNPHNGKIRFALVGKGFMAGLGESLLPVPWQAVSVQPQRGFALNVDKEKLKTAPNWNQAQMDEPDYVIRIYRFYELEPQADIGGLGSSEIQSGQGEGQSKSSGSSDSSSPSSSNSQPDHSPKE